MHQGGRMAYNFHPLYGRPEAIELCYCTHPKGIVVGPETGAWWVAALIYSHWACDGNLWSAEGLFLMSIT